MAVFSQMRAGSPDYLIAPSAPNPKKHATLFSGDNGRRPAPGAQCLPFAAASPPPKPAASAVVALGSLLRHPSTSKPQLSPAVLPRYPAVTDSRSPSSSTVGVGRPPTIGRRRPGGCAFRRPSPQRMPRLSPAASTHRRSRRQPRPSPAAISISHGHRPPPHTRHGRLHPPRPSPSATAVRHGRLHPPREPPPTDASRRHAHLHPPRPSRRLHPPRPAVVCHGRPFAAAVSPAASTHTLRLPPHVAHPPRPSPHAAAVAPGRTFAMAAAAAVSRRPPPHTSRGGRLHPAARRRTSVAGAAFIRPPRPSATAVRHGRLHLPRELCAAHPAWPSPSSRTSLVGAAFIRPPRPPPSTAGAARRTSSMAVSIRHGQEPDASSG